MPATLERVGEYLRHSWEFAEIVVVDDGSGDGTVAVAEAFASRNRCVRVLRNPGNRGKGYSVRHGMLEARGEWALFTDADLSSPIEELEKLWSAAEREKAHAAIGSRALDRSLIGVHQPAMREYLGRAFNLLVRIATGLPFRDTQCGFKLFRTPAAREIFTRQKLAGFGFDVEILYIAALLGYKTLEVPVRWDNAEGTKVSLWRGLDAYLDLLRIRRNGARSRYS